MGLKRKTTTGRIIRAADGTLKKCECCGACECDATNEDCYSDGSVPEYRQAWDGGAPTVSFSRNAATCCDPDLTYWVYRFRSVSSAPTAGVLQVITVSGEGTNPVTLVYREELTGSPTFEFSYSATFEGCAAPDPFDEDITLYQAGEVSQGETAKTVSVFRGWKFREDAFGNQFSGSFYNAAIRDEADDCLVGCGACCIDGDFCIHTGSDTCSDLGGTFTPGGRCGSEELACDPPQTGACCAGSPGYGCTQEEEGDCDALPGLFLGIGVPCEADPCPPEPTGACCFTEDPCLDDTTPTSCSGAGGTFQGAGTTCAESECDPDLGACCFPNGFCDLETEVDCENNGGTFAGLNTTCNLTTCPAGACCLPNGTCVLATSGGCDTQSGFFQGAGTTCEGRSCLGCCCKDGVALGDMSQADCQAATGEWYGPNFVCGVTPDAVAAPGVIDCATVSGSVRDSGGFL